MASKPVLAKVTIATAGTPVQLNPADWQATSLLIQADPLNTGSIYVGDTTVSSSTGIALSAGQTLSITPDEIRAHSEGIVMNDIWFDTATGGNAARITYLKRR